MLPQANHLLKLVLSKNCTGVASITSSITAMLAKPPP